MTIDTEIFIRAFQAWLKGSESCRQTLVHTRSEELVYKDYIVIGISKCYREL